ncbi:O-methyltransferase, partial [Bacillus licheniformis]|nr:O-methyltransferase [Bacillus licheniformis]
ILEVGTLGGYSTIWLARALPPGGALVTLELNPAHAKVATQNIARAGFAQVVSVVVGSAKDSLARLIDTGEAPFDFIFIDADKDNNAVYLDAALKLSRPGTVIVVDNVVRNGRVVDPDNREPDVAGVRAGFA